MWERRPPGDVALRVLEALFEDRGASRAALVDRSESRGEGSPATGTRPRAGDRGDGSRTVELTAFQEEGARRVREILARRGGAILADAVGLGKTYIAVDILEERIRWAHDAVVIVPASVRRSWRPLLRRLDRAVSGAGATPGRARDRRSRLVSHAQLSRGVGIRPADGPRLIVVDEAHRFRNPTTRRYRGLARLVHGPEAGRRPVELLLVTATPVNNSVLDLYHLLRLFLRDDALSDVGVPSLLAAFRPDAGAPAVRFAGDVSRGDEAPPRYDAARVRAVTRAVQVRRTRGMVEARFGGIVGSGDPVGFPRRAPPSFERYMDPRLGEAVECIEALELRVYETAGPLVRLGLLKRMDSSAAAFVASVARLQAALDAVADAAEGGRLLRPDGRPHAGDADPLQLFLLDVVAEAAPPDVDLAALAASCRRDLLVLQGLAGRAPADAKSVALRRLLERLRGEKVVVFTEYRDTAEDLARRLAGRFRVGRVDGSGAWLGRRRAGRRAVVDRFAPAANGRPSPPDRERVDVLISTDVLSEGLNLQDARHVVSYDLPWNPVRLLQRVGRVDRLGSPHAVVYPHLFVPADGLDAVLGLTRRLRTKLDGIAVAVGGSSTEELLAGLQAGRPGAVAAVLDRVAEREAVDPWEQLRTLWLGIRGSGTWPQPNRPWIGVVEVPASHPASAAQAVVLAAGHGPRLVEVAASGRTRRPGPATVAAVRAALGDGTGQSGANEENAHGSAAAENMVPRATEAVSPHLRQRTRMAMRTALEHLRAAAAAARAPKPLRATGPEARLTRRLREGLARAGSGLDPGTLHRAETLLRVLGAPLPPAASAAIVALLERTEDAAPTGRLIRDALRALRDHGVPGPEGAEPLPPGAPGCRPSGAVGSGFEPRIEAVLLIVMPPT